ncbi:MAG: hypothetical protein CSA95_08840 [Bacteroidetes bacterium]|nr:MAG: hypothetical protein CSA95_08840 [Bacteroidota bacterium]
MRHSILALLFALLFSFPLSAQKEGELDKIFAEKREVCFYAYPQGLIGLDKLGNIISIDKVFPDRVFAYAGRADFERFLALDIPYYFSFSPSELATGIVMKEKVDLSRLEAWDFYPTYDEYVALMYEFETNYPDLCEVISFGESTEGRKLLAARIHGDLSQHSAPEFFYTSTMHGDETTGFVGMIALIDYLLKNYGGDDEVTALLDNVDIYINPNANPDGTYAAGNHTVTGATRSNANGVDLNRNYPDPQDGPHPDGHEWQAETVAFMAFAEAHNFVMSANFHGGSEVVNYPFDTWSTLHADDLWYRMISHEYADTCQQYSPDGYMSGYDDGITNGYDWYSINGSRQDYMNSFQRCREVTIELSDTKLLPAQELDSHWEYNRRSYINLIKQATYGLRGTVTDLATGEPLQATLFIEDHDRLGSQVESNGEDGMFYRPVKGGEYDLTFLAAGYMPLQVNGVQVTDYGVTQLEVQLDVGSLTAGFTVDNTVTLIGEELAFSDRSYGNPVAWEWTFEGGDPATSTEQNPVVSWSSLGTYDVSLTVYDADGNQQTLTREDYITVSQEYTMQNTTVTTCAGVFLDTGGSAANYGNNEDYTMTFYPGEEHRMLRCEFLAFNLEYQDDCEYDYLKVYDGANSSAPLLGTFCGNTPPPVLQADNEEGALTFVFHSDISTTAEGWMASIVCVNGVGIDGESHPKALRIYPNPVKNILRVESPERVVELVFADLSGRRLKHLHPHNGSLTLDLGNLDAGIYLVTLLTEGGDTHVKKVVVGR